MINRQSSQNITIEIYFNPYAFHESITKYQIENDGDWIKTKNGYMMREFGNYAILIYPILSQDNDIVMSLSEKLDNLDRFRESLMKPGNFKDSITLHVTENEITTSLDLDLQEIVGLSLVNDVISQKGVLFKENEDLTYVSVSIKRPLTSNSLSEYFSKIAYALKLYYKIREEQEDIALKTSLQFVNFL
ncbi:hypothetical protein [Sulfuracidifex metallicus]|uniref:hypothetical protein n=1 Tax=Sulfuracidifex metallicus TaxID=47303 RepID=UPI0022740A72|nr:hypothetical protein [Sulfuracidifex metallicus]MCY0849371.1 hypothetical protein [Sulfuracidifex metallicus]